MESLSKAQLAEKLGVRQNMINDYERGKRRLSLSMAKRIAKILHEFPGTFDSLFNVRCSTFNLFTVYCFVFSVN